ncbi:hypothetical protein B2G71_19300 [Novosphingobium sp. PC22D]|uniref:hypothetical protein n=1 Tax=Novosphingobium sp. PC22D TaxID=1962403 RepID=UPI000BF0C2DC|nr:hypothetical protein [Novosphingobium sp. PC22D]PEQ10966.1 hypothetical protein B2G71_19300 [Novosphingobium sp. PC22D]
MLNFIAIIMYAAVIVACLMARNAAVRRGAKADGRTFAVTAFVFAMLVLSRAMGAEEMLHDILKGRLLHAGGYADRRSFQEPVVIFGFLLLFAFAFYKGYRFLEAPARFSCVSIVSAACWAMAALAFARTVSWHTTDKILFGTFHLNWFLDLGCTLAAGIGSAYYVHRTKLPAWGHRTHH